MKNTPLPPSLRPRLCAALCTLLLAGCATPYERPAVQLPAQWQYAQQHEPTSAQGTQAPWWLELGDAQLNSLMDLALRSNNDLASAAYTVRNAQLAARSALGQRLPEASAGLDANASRNVSAHDDFSRNHSAHVSASWELDLWGKLASTQRRAQWQAAASEQDRQAVAQTLTGTVATTYWQIAVLDLKIASQQESLARAAQTLQMAQTQYEAGALSGLDVAQAQHMHATQQSAIHALQQQGVELRHALAILFDAAPAQLPAAAQHPRLPDMARLPEVPSGVPADILARRPDLQAAEMRLRAALAEVDVARASLYPAFRLTASLGSSSAVLSQVLKNPVATLGAGLSLPFLNWSELRRNSAMAQNSYEQAVTGFRQTLYKALADAENALSQRTRLQQQAALQGDALQAARRIEALSAIRYRAGAVALKQWLDAQDALQAAQLALYELQLAQLNNLVALQHALGGALPKPLAH